MGIYDNDEQAEEQHSEPKKIKARKRKVVTKKKTPKKTTAKQAQPSKFAKKLQKKAKELSKKEAATHLENGREIHGTRKGKQITITPEEFFASQKPTPDYVKHLIRCRCFLPQFKEMDPPPDHQFVVFSELNSKGLITPHYAQCNNCLIIHKVFEVGVSQTLKKETLMTLPTINDFKTKLPAQMVEILTEHACELHIWQEAYFILKHKLWGRFIILAKERDEDLILGKILQILGENLFNIETFERDEGYVKP